MANHRCKQLLIGSSPMVSGTTVLVSNQGLKYFQSLDGSFETDRSWQDLGRDVRLSDEHVLRLEFLIADLASHLAPPNSSSENTTVMR